MIDIYILNMDPLISNINLNFQKQRIGINKLDSKCDILNTKCDYVANEIKNIYSMIRNMQQDNTKPYDNVSSTYDSFNEQWKDIEIPDIDNHINTCTKYMLEWTQHERSWFKNKKVLDAGCGIGRFSYGFLECGADLKSIDYSINGVNLTKKNCSKFKHNNVHRVNILTCNTESEMYDLVWSYGVCHHTGNTKLALLNLFSKVKKGGEIFIMLYGFPENDEQYKEIMNYETLRSELITISEKDTVNYLKKALLEKFPNTKPKNQSAYDFYNTDKGKMFLHGYYDAVVPAINELLSFKEIYIMLKNQGFHNIRVVNNNRNHHVMASKCS